MSVDYGKFIADSRSELKEMVGRRDATDKRIAQLTIALRAMARFMPDAHREAIMREVAAAQRRMPTISEAILDVLREPSIQLNGLTGQQIRERLEEAGFDLAHYSQPLGTIFASLKRLCDKEFVKRTKGNTQTIVFRLGEKAKERGAE